MSGMLSRAIRDSFAAFDTTPKLVGVTLLGMVVTAVIVWLWRGTEAVKKHLAENFFIVIGGALATWVLVFSFTYIRLPFKMLRESDANLSKVIEEKRQLSMVINAQNAQLVQDKIRIKNLENNLTRPGQTASINETTKRQIQHQLTGFINAGIALQNEWNKRLGGTEETQRPSALAIQDWHKTVEEYLKTIPHGEIYVVRLRNPVRAGGAYPIGISLNLAGTYDRLLSDLIRLNEFITDPDLGKP